MFLSVGTKLGSYEILRPLGAGGMGEVYRARDNKLGRDVAVKVLSEAFTRDPQRMARFEREAKVLASLNHPNIASIYGLEDSNNLQALVLELVEGPTLADRIKQGALPVEDALHIAKQIAEALEYAHEHGVVHRDLKPANIKLTNADVVKVLDFGLAKAIERDASSIDVSTSPTISHMATEVGIILGTAAYMSPEQAKGKSVDRRADIWSFGCVLLEMLTGKNTFSGETVTDTLAAVVLKEPDWSGLPESMPSSIRELLERCLKKDQRQRLQAIGDARITIEEALDGNRKEKEQPEEFRAPRQFQWLSILPWLFVVLLAGVSAWSYLFPKPRLNRGATLMAALYSGAAIDNPVISPDGEMVVFEDEGKLWLRSVNELAPRVLAGTEGGESPFWSPDSKSIGYFHQGELRRISSRGGPSTLICQVVSDRQIPPATWGAEDRIVFQSIPDGFFEVSAGGGTARSIAKPDQAKDEVVLRDPHFLVDGKTLVLIVRRPGPGVQLDTIAVQTGSERSVVLQMPGAVLLNVVSSEKTGHLLFVKHNQPNPGLWAVPFSFSKLHVTGKPFLVHANADAPSVSSNGDLVYMTTTSESQELSWVDRTGKILGVVGSPRDDMRDPVISPDGKQVALSSGGDKFGIWVMDSTRNTATSLTGGIYWAAFPEWLASSRSMAFVCLFSENSEENLCTASADGSGKPQPILTLGLDVGLSVSPDQKSILFSKRNDADTFEIWRAVFQKDAKPEPFLATQFNELAPRISPNGHYVAYQSDESGRYEVYVRPYPAGEGRWMISTNGGTTPKWSPKGDELFYLQGDTLMVVSVLALAAFKPNVPHALFSGKTVTSSMAVFGSPLYDVAPDGKRFVVIRDGKIGPRSIVVEQDWPAKIEKQ